MDEKKFDCLGVDGLEGTVIWKQFSEYDVDHGDYLGSKDKEPPIEKPPSCIEKAITKSQEHTGDTVDPVSDSQTTAEKNRKLAAMIQEGQQLQMETNELNAVMVDIGSNHRTRHYRTYGVRIEFTDQIFILNRCDVADDKLDLVEHQFDTWYSSMYARERPTSSDFVDMQIDEEHVGNANYLKYELDQKIQSMRENEKKLCDWVLDDLYDASGGDLNYLVLNSLFKVLADASDKLFDKPATLQKQYVLNRIKGLKLNIEGYAEIELESL